MPSLVFFEFVTGTIEKAGGVGFLQCSVFEQSLTRASSISMVQGMHYTPGVNVAGLTCGWMMAEAPFFALLWSFFFSKNCPKATNIAATRVCRPSRNAVEKGNVVNTQTVPKPSSKAGPEFPASHVTQDLKGNADLENGEQFLLQAHWYIIYWK